MSLIEWLPVELLLLIINFLPLTDRLRIPQLCQTFNNLLESNQEREMIRQALSFTGIFMSDYNFYRRSILEELIHIEPISNLMNTDVYSWIGQYSMETGLMLMTCDRDNKKHYGVGSNCNCGECFEENMCENCDQLFPSECDCEHPSIIYKNVNSLEFLAVFGRLRDENNTNTISELLNQYMKIRDFSRHMKIIHHGHDPMRD